MKLLLVSLNHAPEQTGIGRFQGEMAAWFAARGHEVRVVAAPPYYPMWKISSGYSAWRYKKEIIDGATVYRVPLYVPDNKSGIRRLLHLASFAMSSFPLVVGLALFWRPDAIVLTEPPFMAVPSVLLAGFLSQAKTLLHVQDFEIDAAFDLGLLKNGRLRRLALASERAFMRGFSFVSSISPRMRDRLLAKGVEDKRALLIPNWANVEDFDPAKGSGLWREKLKRADDTVLALYAGNLGRKQGLEVIVETARRLSDNKKILIAVSGDGAGRDELIARAAGLENIVFLPLQPMDLFVHLMLAADIHLLPQRAEATDLVMPSKLGNILASGRPVLAGAKKGSQVFDAIQGCGLAVEPDDVDAFVAGLLSLAASPEIRATMGIQGRLRARDDWARDAILTRLEKILTSGSIGES